MDRTLAQGRAAAGSTTVDRASRWIGANAGIAIVLAMLAIYVVSDPARHDLYDHFVWQASAWLEGKAAIRYPVYPGDGLGTSDFYFQDVLPVPTSDGIPRALIPFPPLPAVVLLPFVAVFGLATKAQLIASVLGALDVGIAFWVLGRLPVRPSVRIATTILFGLGTVFWYAAELGSTWYLAHVVAVGLALLAVALALDGDPRALGGAARADASVGLDGAGAGETAATGQAAPSSARTGPARALAATWPLDRRQLVAGMLLGLAATSRLTVALGLPFLLLVGGGRTPLRRAVSATVGVAIPLLGLAVYDLVSTGHVFNPVYDHLYRTEISFYPPLFPYLDYHADWAIEDPRYIIQNLRLMLLALPVVGAPCPDSVPPVPVAAFCQLQPRADGMSLLLTSPALLMALPALAWFRRSRLVAGCTIAIALIAVGDLMHFSQGWVQFGYRFSNDFIPFLLPLVALGLERLGGVRRLAVTLIAASVVVNLWGVLWGHLLGW
ncbi:MAG TPA: hypothetical protein VEY67_12050 [Candidatus Dormibacteraeota bacterium]|nr:hypothetical protein [Candidatus Dormibacteraeota bacterium]